MKFSLLLNSVRLSVLFGIGIQQTIFKIAFDYVFNLIVIIAKPIAQWQQYLIIFSAEVLVSLYTLYIYVCVCV